ncbi:aldehyde dehydrogenase family protein, partial [Mycobacterium tuberculosis]|nr:aldehyde dehydrogenase family protein [Mycobacterium tuberculosis]
MPSPTRGAIDVTNPFDNQVIATIPSLEKSQVIDAVAIAHKAQIDWAQKTANERAAILNNWADLIDQNKEDLATIMTAE